MNIRVDECGSGSWLRDEVLFEVNIGCGWSVLSSHGYSVELEVELRIELKIIIIKSKGE